MCAAHADSERTPMTEPAKQPEPSESDEEFDAAYWPPTRRREGFAIRETGPRQHRLLDGYVFQNERHAREWFAQGFKPRENGYELWRVELTADTCRCCGHWHGPQVKRWIERIEEVAHVMVRKHRR